jgi:hypothetical protein
LSARSPRRQTAATILFESPFTRPLTRLEPRDGLVIDAETWSIAHGYHTETGRFHNLAGHGAGILVGLDVVPVSGHEIGVLPGVGIDPSGAPLVITVPTRISVDAATVQIGPVYIVLRRADEEPDDDGRVKEASVIQALGALPDEPHLELARVTLGSRATIGLAADPRDPGPDDIDTRFRLLAGGHARGEVAIGEMRVPDAGQGHAGVGAVIARAVSLEGTYRARYVGEVELGTTAPDGGILYVTGNQDFTLNQGAVAWLRAFLEAGGTLVGDGCHSAAADPFGSAFDKLAKSLGRQLKRVVAGERLLWAHHVFGAPPPGQVKTDVGLVLATGGIVYCASDYGCVLRGDGDPSPTRAAIHAVEEFATNLVASARERALSQPFVEAG